MKVLASHLVHLLVALKCSPHVPTLCSVQRSLFFLLSIHWWKQLLLLMPRHLLRRIAQQLLQRPTTSVKTIRKKRLVCSRALWLSTLSLAAKFLSTSPTMCSWATAPAPSWLCQVVTNATLNSHARTTCPSPQPPCHLLLGLNSTALHQAAIAVRGPKHSPVMANTSTPQTSRSV